MERLSEKTDEKAKDTNNDIKVCRFCCGSPIEKLDIGYYCHYCERYW